jgi:plasmid stabilization system protein ParE
MWLSFSRRALHEISEIYEYLARENPAAAAKVLERIHQLSLLAADYPHTGRSVSLSGVRMLPVAHYPYLIFFRRVPGRSEVRILRVRHAARRHPGFQEEAGEFVSV